MRLEKDARRAQLIEAATRVFARQGYAAADVTAIVTEAGVVRGTFYLYFQAKRDVLLAIVDQYLELMRAQATLPPPPASLPLREQLAHAFAQALQLHAGQRDLALVVLRDGWAADAEVVARLRAAGEATKAGLAASYRRLMEAGALRPADSSLAASAVGGMLREVLLHEVLLKERTEAIPAMADELAGLIYDGLRPRA